MRPVDEAAFRIPYVLAVETDGVAWLESHNARGDVDVVDDEERLA